MSTEAGMTETEQARSVQNELSLTGFLGKVAAALAWLLRSRKDTT